MAYKDKEKQREFQRKWMEKRRQEVLQNKTCRDCGSNSDLTFVNVKNGGKNFSLSYTKEKLDQKINDALILCDNCYIEFDKDRKEKRATKHGHAGERSYTYISWRSMLERCYNMSKDNYHYYGGRGIEVCERWHKFENFLSDMGERPNEMTLDRIDPFKNYEPDNCRWATATEQARNKRKNYI